MQTKSLIAALLLTASSAFAQVPSYVPTYGLVGWWPFNNNANDESGNGYDLIPVGSQTSVSDRLLNNNSAYYFSSGYPTQNKFDFPLNAINTFNNLNAGTISFWVYINSHIVSGHYFGFDNIFFNKEKYGSNAQCLIGLNGGTTKVRFHMTGALPSSDLISKDSLGVGVWHHLNITWDGSTHKIYIDGNLDTLRYSTDYLTNQSNPSYLSLGAFDQVGSPGCYSTLDDLGLWTRALSPQEITALYNAQTCNSTSNTITADGPTTFCAGNYVNLTSDVVGGTYQWKKNGVNITTNGTSRTYKATATGSYTCVATCNGTALTSNAIAVTTKTNAFASVSASGATSFCAGDSVTLNCTNLGSNYSVQWYRTNISMENATNYSQVVKQPGTYKVVTKNLTTGCSRISGSSVVVAVNCRMSNPNVVAVDNDLNDEATRTIRDEMPETVRVYPNPNEGSFTFEFQTDNEGTGELQIINVMGQSIYNANVAASNGLVQHQINLGDHFEKGLYVVRYTFNGEQYDRKLILK